MRGLSLSTPPGGNSRAGLWWALAGLLFGVGLVSSAYALCARLDHERQVLAAIPQTSLSLFEQSGHAPFWEEPERFNTEVMKFASSV
jgi:non-heme chloroperoxidase